MDETTQAQPVTENLVRPVRLGRVGDSAPVQSAYQEASTALDIEIAQLFEALELHGHKLQPIINLHNEPTDSSGEKLAEQVQSEIVADLFKKARKVRDARIVLNKLTEALQV